MFNTHECDTLITDVENEDSSSSKDVFLAHGAGSGSSYGDIDHALPEIKRLTKQMKVKIFHALYRWAIPLYFLNTGEAYNFL
jgi:hypothetical protein